ncbi:MAG: bifunctional shikimate kinase/3-dehydroquinate synthase [Solirubrobacterales bacterium]
MSDAPQPPIAFVGFMGAGKTTAARVVGDALGEPVVDADEQFVLRTGETISEHFQRHGEAAFREREEQITLELLGGGGVVALGGGAVESPRIREALKGAVTVLVEVDVGEAWRRSRDSGRPLAMDFDAFQARYEARRSLYTEVADAILPPGDADQPGRAAPWLARLRAAPGIQMAWARSASAEYPVLVGPGAVDFAGQAVGPGRLFALADREAAQALPELLPGHEQLLEVTGGEQAKTLRQAEQLLETLLTAGVRRDDTLAAFGGGVVGDLAGFCAAVYLRGVPVVQIPTTLVAQVDSAYGGKTGVDLPAAKNAVGSFHLPQAVLADPAALRTLPAAELAAGFAEVVKTALLAGGALWERVRVIDALDAAALDGVIFDCARTKLAVVAADERDTGARAALNLGHTVGHGIEAAGAYGRYRHGEAVGLGMLAALRLSDASHLRGEVAELLALHGLPTALDATVETDAVMQAMTHDKKQAAGGLGFVLLSEPGHVEVGHRVDEADIRAAIDELRGSPR